jgi:hypothetical protein
VVLHPALVEAAAAVRRDLGPLGHDAALEQAIATRSWWLDEWEAGAELVLCLLAQDVQEAVHATDPTWPLCSETSCPERFGHALFVEPDLGPDPFWTCHRTGLPVAPVGSLRG